MNAYPLGLSLMKINDQFKTKSVDLEDFETAGVANMYPINDLPSKEKFRESEFWLVYYDSFNDTFYEEWNVLSSEIHETAEYGQWWDINGLEVHVNWSQKGALYSVMVGESDNDYVTQVWREKETELKERYPGRRVELVNVPGKLPRIHIDFWDHPVSWLMTASTEEKVAHAERLNTGLCELRFFMEDALDDLKKLENDR
jgi:hypothetical protein